MFKLPDMKENILLVCFSVFDDGDEKTLRRTSLCLKGERHFAESEVRKTDRQTDRRTDKRRQKSHPLSSPQTLDQLPLTNPEHFGTPVIGKKSNRGGRRSSQAV